MIFDPRPYAAGITRLNEAEARAIRERVILAESEASSLAAAIRSGDAGVRAVYLFGSLARGTPRHLDFDIDLAIEGGDLYRALDLVDDSSFRVDLVDLEKMPEPFAQSVRTTGRRLA